MEDGLFQVPNSANWNMKTLVIHLWADLFVESTHHHLIFPSVQHTLKPKINHKEKMCQIVWLIFFGYELISYSSLRMLVRIMFATIVFLYSRLNSNIHANNIFPFSCFCSPLSFFYQDSNRNIYLEYNRQDTYFHWDSTPCIYFDHIGDYQKISGWYDGWSIGEYSCRVDE